VSRMRARWWEQSIRVTVADYMEGVRALLNGRTWDGPWSRAAREWYDESRRLGAVLQEELAASGAVVSLEMCRDAVDNGWADSLQAYVSARYGETPE
jgi:hypothetical protein